MTVDYATCDGSAVAPGDYVAASGTLTFTPGQTAKQIVVAVKGDTLNEVNETYTVNLANPTNATISGTGIGTGTITNDDAVPTLSINNVSAGRGQLRARRASPSRSRSPTASGLPVSVDFATADGIGDGVQRLPGAVGNPDIQPGADHEDDHHPGQRRHLDRAMRDLLGPRSRTPSTRPSPGPGSAPARSPTTTERAARSRPRRPSRRWSIRRPVRQADRGRAGRGPGAWALRQLD